MQIDRSRIAIRERTWSDNLDLALQVIRTNAGGIVTSALVGVLPMIALNYTIIQYSGSRLNENADFDGMMLAILLVMCEAPLATAAVTLYLGQALFVEHPDAKKIARDFLSCLPQLILFQVLLRPLLIFPILTWIVPYGLWPYLNEIILLERNPLVTRGGQMSTMKRNSLMHRGGGGDNLVRAMGTGLLALLLVVAMWISQSLLFDVLLGMQQGWVGQVISLQCVLWVVAVYFTVARFLTYLDQRIRNEGWEVELFLRAQARTPDEAGRMSVSRQLPLVLRVLVLLLAWSLPGFDAARGAEAQTSEDPAVVAGREALTDGEYPWYDSQTDSLQPVEITIEEDSPRRVNWNLGPLIEILAWSLLGVLLAAAVVLLIMFAINQQRAPKVQRTTTDQVLAPDQVEALTFLAERPRGDLLGQARRHYEAGNYSEAIIYLFSYELLALDKFSLIRLAKGKTNRQYLREVSRNAPVRSPLERTLLAFESVFFGSRSLDRAGFEACWNELPLFEQELRAPT